MGQRLSLNVATISRLEDLIPISASASGRDDDEGQGPPDRSEALREEQQNTIRLKLLKANVVSAATSHHGNNVASSASPKSFVDRRRRGTDAAFKHELGRRPSYSSDNISQPSFGEEQTALILEKMKNIGPLQQFVEQLSNEEKLLKSYLDFNWMTTVALIERSASESMRFLSKGIGDFFNVAITEMQLKISDSQADLTSLESIHGQHYVEVKLVIVPYIHFNEGSSFSTISFPVLDHFPVDSEDEPFVVTNVSPRSNNTSNHNTNTSSSSSPLRINVTKKPSKFTLALVVGPWLVFFDPLTSLVIPKKLYGMAKIIASNLPELFITKQKEKLTEKLAKCIVSWNTSKLFKNEKDIFSSPRQNSTTMQQQSMYGNGIDFIDDYLLNYLNIDYTTFPLVRYFKTFLGNARQQGWSQMVIDLDENLIGKYGPVLTPTTPLHPCFDFSQSNNKRISTNNNNENSTTTNKSGNVCTLIIESHEELDNMIKDMMIHDLMEHAASFKVERTSTPETPLGSEPPASHIIPKKESHKTVTQLQQPSSSSSAATTAESESTNTKKKTTPVSHFFIDVLRMFDRAWWMRHLFDVNEEHVEISTPSNKKHVSTTVQSSGDSPTQIRHTRDYISEIGCPFGHAIPDYEKNLECYPRRRKKKLKQQGVSRPNSPSSPNTSRRSITSLSPRKSPSIRSNASPKTPVQPYPQSTSSDSIPIDGLNEIKR
nr:unnamed protein product [Naegleria fowleri]